MPTDAVGLLGHQHLAFVRPGERDITYVATPVEPLAHFYPCEQGIRSYLRRYKLESDSNLTGALVSLYFCYSIFK